MSPVASLGRYYAWLTRSRIPQPPGVVGFEIGGCYGGNGCIDWADPPVVRLAPWARKLRSTFYHEIGHVFDYYVLEPAGYRDSFLPLVRRPTYDRLATERFADAYMLCAQSGHLRKTVVTRYYRYKATPAIHRSACNLIRGVASIRYQQSLQGAAQTQ